MEDEEIYDDEDQDSDIPNSWYDKGMYYYTLELLSFASFLPYGLS